MNRSMRTTTAAISRGSLHVRSQQGMRPYRAGIRKLRQALATSKVSATRERHLVEAMCACLLDDGSMPLSSWAPTSIAELESGRAVSLGSANDVLPAAKSLLSLGIMELDAAALSEEGLHFERLDQETQLRLLGRLEQGQFGLSRISATAFLDHFMALAAQAYLCAGFSRLNAAR